MFRNLIVAFFLLACMLPAAHATVYTYVFGGYWSNAANWSGSVAPPGTLLPGDAIVISGVCNLDVNITVPAGATITLDAGQTMIMAGGTLTVEGTFDMNGTLECNTFGSVLNYTNGTVNVNGTVNAYFAGVITASGSGTFAINTGAVNLYGDGELLIGGTGTVASGAGIYANDPTTNLSIGANATLTSSGTITVSGALNMSPSASTFVNEVGGILNLNTGTNLTGTQTVQNDGAILIANAVTLTLGPNAMLINLGAVNGAGTLQMDGTYQGTGSVDANFTGTGTVMPGNPAGLHTACTSFNGGYSFTGTWEIELEGTGGCADHDQVTSGAASFPLGGTLNVTLGASYTPVLPATYFILVATNSTGSFSTENLPPVSGAVWSIAYNATTVELTLTACTAPDVPVVTASKSHSCVVESTGETITLDVGGASLGDATDWVWYEGSCGGTSIGMGATLAVTVTATTTYYVRGEGGCVGTCGSITITAGDAPDISGVTNYTPAFCSGEIGQFSVAFSGGTGAVALVYSDGTTNSTITGYKSDGAIQVTPVTNTTYEIVSITDDFGCQDYTATTVSMVVHPAYSVTLVADGPTSVCNGASATLKLTAIGSTGPLNYQLSANASEGPSGGGYTPGNPIIATPAAGDALSVYTINTVSDANLCSPTTATGSVTITQNTDPAYRVKAGASGAANGLTWADAFTNLHEAFDAQAACPGVTEIWVATGTYKPERDINNVVNATNRANTFRLPPNIHVYGGFPATGEPVFASRNSVTYPTLLSGDIGTPGDPSDNVYHVVYVPMTTSNAGLHGCTIRDGNANTVSLFDGVPSGNMYGGGALLVGEGLYMDSCRFTQNFAAFGGGMTCYSPDGSTPSSPSFVNTTFIDNDASTAGGGLYLQGSGSGAICSPTLLNCVFELNTCSASGAGLYANGNSAGNSSPSLTNCIFSENLATDDGGGAYLDGNIGGNANAVFINCVFSTNSATSGGAIYGDHAGCNLNLSTFFNNAASSGGAVYIGNSSTCFVQDGIVWANSVPALQSVASTLNVIYTLNQDGIVNTGNINVNPVFINSAIPKGADGEWFTNDDGLRISSGSPAQNAANPITNTPLTDASDLARVGVYDMGAYEYTACVPLGNATRLYVNGTLGVDGEGASWGDGYMNLTNALQKAYDCNQITEMWVAAGTYKPTDKPAGCTTCGGGRDIAFRIPDGLDIYGGFDNIGTATLLSQRNPTANPTILSGDLMGDDGSAMYSDNAYHVVLMVDNPSSTLLDGFTVQGGIADGAGFISFGATNVYQNNGGGMAMFNASPVVQNCIIRDNQATSNGGGGYSTNYGSPTFTACEVLNNYAGSFGGGIYINATASTVTLSQCLIANNNASTKGGGLMFTAGGTYAVEGTVVADNVSQQGGGIYADGSSQVVMTNTVLSKNTSGTASNAMVEIINASASATNCTFVATGIAAEGACLLDGPGSYLDVVNSIVWNNSDPILTDATGTTTVTYSIVQGASVYPGTGNSASDPLFGNMGTPKGGDNTWRTGDDGLIPGNCSPAINAATATGAPTFDILDIAASGTKDIGAYEQVDGAPRKLHVNHATVGGDGSGNSWANAYTSLGNALAFVAACNKVDTLWVATGTYFPNRDASFAIPPTDPREATFHIPATLRVFGGFAGTETALTQRDFVLNPTILSGDVGTIGVPGDNSYNVVRITAADTICSLSGFIIRDGGTGISIGAGAKPRFRHCVVTSNTASGVSIEGGQPRFISTVIAGNTNTGDGGGFVIGSGGTADLYNCVIASNTSGGYGGGFYTLGGHINLHQCVVVNNTTAVDGSGGYIWDATLNMSNSIFVNNPGVIPLGEWGTISGTFRSNVMNFAPSVNITNIGPINDDPMFAYPNDPDGPDDKWFTTDDGLKVLCGSSAIDAAATVTVPAGTTSKDILGTERPQGASYDIGAYEWVPFAAAPARLYVRQATTGTQEGTDWTLAFKELRHALACQAITPSVNEIWVGQGTYLPESDNGRSSSFDLPVGVALYGGMAGTEILLADRTWPTATPSVLSGDIGTPADNTDNCYHVVTATNVTSTSILNGFTLTEGNANGTGAGAKGGGIGIANASPLIEKCTIDGNAAIDGAGVAIVSPTLTPSVILTELRDCTLTNNAASNSGGGIYAEQMGVNFTGTTTISGNTHAGSCE